MVRMSDYSYPLADEFIARFPASPRGSSKLLRVNGDEQASWMNNFSETFPKLARDTHVILNDSRVLEARLYLRKKKRDDDDDNDNDEGKSDDGSRVECMILDLGHDEILSSPCNQTTLRCMVRCDNVKVGDMYTVTMATGVDQVRIVSVQGVWQEDEASDGNGTDCFLTIENGDLTVSEYLSRAGNVPIPPYFQRQAEESDKESYNNVYATADGSVAAPTAGLHFTHDVLSTIGIDNTSFLTLHCGAGTFKPVLVEDARSHEMHAETFSVSVRQLQRILAVMENNKPLVVVGTTSCRTLESLYWCGVKALLAQEEGKNNSGVDVSNLELGQFEWQSLKCSDNISRVDALRALVDRATAIGTPRGNNKDDDNLLICGRTSLMITPDIYKFRVVDHLVTNFHAPDSTLMLLVSSFLSDSNGDKIRSLYLQAQERRYRFLSYGDVCFFSRPGCTLPSDNNNNTMSKAAFNDDLAN